MSTIIKKVFLSLTATAGLLLLIEVALWAYFAGKDIPWGPSVKWYQAKYYKLNSLSFRDREHSKEKPPNTWRIVVLGDSFSFPANLRRLQDGYVYQLEQKLNARRPTMPIEVINVAKTGFNTMDQKEILTGLALSYRPDVVLVGYVLNDADPNRAPTHLVPPMGDSLSEELAHARQAVQKAFLEGNWEWLRSYIKLRSYTYSFVDIRFGMLAGRVKGSNNWFEQETKRLYTESQLGEQRKVIKSLVEAAGAQHATTGAVLLPYFYKLRQTPFAHEHRVIQEAFEQSNALVLDLYPVFSSMDEAELVLGWWDPHPNERAHALAADAVVQWLVEKGLVP